MGMTTTPIIARTTIIRNLANLLPFYNQTQQQFQLFNTIKTARPLIRTLTVATTTTTVDTKYKLQQLNKRTIQFPLDDLSIDRHTFQRLNYSRSLCVINNNNKNNYSNNSLRQIHTTSTDKRRKRMDSVPNGIFCGEVDRFNGITIDSKLAYEDNVDFEDKLKKSLKYWREHKRRAIWFHVHTKHANWIPLLVQNGFEFHFARSGLAVLICWLPAHETLNVPNFAHTMLGVGGIVVNDKNEVLVVTDKNALIPNSWKLPGGYVDPGEDLVDAAKREVFEETNIECDFKTMIAIRHAHGGDFGCSDMYVVVALTPRTSEIQMCSREIARCEWMPISKYLENPNVHETNRLFMKTYLEYQRHGICFTYERATHEVLKRNYALYFMKPIEASDVGTQKNP